MDALAGYMLWIKAAHVIAVPTHVQVTVPSDSVERYVLAVDQLGWPELEVPIVAPAELEPSALTV